MDSFVVRKRVLCNFLINDKNSVSDLVNHLQIKYKINPDKLEVISNRLTSHFLNQFKKKWKECFCLKNRFEKKNKNWLDSDFVVPFTETKPKKGRKCSTMEFEEASVSTKRRKLLSIEENFTAIEIQEAFLRMLRTTGRIKIANSILSLLNDDQAQSSDLSDSNVAYSAEEAIALSEQAKLSKYQYQTIQSQAKERNADIYPPYHQIIEAKKACYPSKICITEAGASVDIQSLVDHSVKRLFKDPSLSIPIPENRLKITYLKLDFKYGIDGLSTEAKYNQKFSDGSLSDESLLTASMVPMCMKLKNTSEIVWMNPRTSSPKRCIPIMFRFAKETKELTKAEINKIDSEIRNLKPTTITTSDGVHVVEVEMKLTMLDGKVCQALSDTPSAATCYICQATPVQMNNLERVKTKKEIESNLQFGLSTLHAWIRFMECILHIAYRLKIKKWKVSSAEEKEILKNTKQSICALFKEKMGLIIDQPCQGSGNSNCGNTARRFFSDLEQSAEITGVNIELIKKFSQILQMLSSSKKVPTKFFDNFAFKTAELYVKLYPWYYMPSSVHKVLLHGGKVMERFLLPIGAYSEEASEARNKDIKHFRQFNTRKTSRLNTVEDLMHKLLVSSDLYIGSLRSEKNKIDLDLDPEIVELIEKFESGEID